MNRVWLIIFGDFLAFWVSFIAIIAIRFEKLQHYGAIGEHIIPFAILYIFWVLSFFLFGLYDLFSIKPTIPHMSRFALALGTSFVVGIFLFYFVPIFGISPKTNLIFQLLGFGILSFFFRRIVYVLFSKQIVRPVVLVGDTHYIDELETALKKNPQLGLKVLSRTKNLNDSLLENASLQNLVIVVERNIQDIPESDLVKLYTNKTEIIDIAEAYEKYLHKIPIGCISQTWIIENIGTKTNSVYVVITRIINILLSLSIFILTSPLWIISALLVYLYDRGPILYSQERVGLHGKVFRLYKIRSMITDSEKNGAVWSTNNDSRITPIGKILRKLHIDELPQMINIIKGDISLVGPRAERPEFVTQLEKTIPHYILRHVIKPGFTGWAQIKYHYANTVEESKEKFEYDLYYIKNRNIFLDFGIILRTIQIIFTH